MNETAIIFVRIGWMKTYQGSKDGDRPIGAGKFNDDGGIGSENDNFLPNAFGRVHGFFAVKSGNAAINLFQADGVSKSKQIEEISNVLVIFVSKPPNQSTSIGPAIVGWYRNAVLHRQHKKLRETGRLYRSEASMAEAVLVPEPDRNFFIPKASAINKGIGQSNIFYLRNRDGSTRDLPWIQDALKYVSSYRQELPLEPDSVNPDIAAEIEEDRKAGYASNPLLRKVIELRAMEVVRSDYEARGFQLIDRSANNPYDFSYKDGAMERYIEVKGTRRGLSTFILTANEVTFARDHQAEMELCVVHSIDVGDGAQPTAKGGTLYSIRGWNPDAHGLQPTYYSCKLTLTSV